jgi:RNA 2',3'-cyclic 3'-phosphodiesterase
MKKRIFIAIPLSSQLQKHLTEYISGYGETSHIRWLKPHNMHITLVPPWDEDYATDIYSKLESIRKQKKFHIHFSHVELGGPKKNDPSLLWVIGSTNKELVLLRDSVFELIKKEDVFYDKKRTFKTHMTLARFKSDGANELKNIGVRTDFEWDEEVSSIVIMESHGFSEYTILERFEFLNE